MRIFEGIKGVFTTILKCKERGIPMAECHLTAFSKVDSTDDGDYSSRISGVGNLRPEVYIVDSLHKEYSQPRSKASDAMLQYRTDQPYILRPYPYPVEESALHSNSRSQKPNGSPSSLRRTIEQQGVYRPVWADVNSPSVDAISQSSLAESNELSFPKVIPMFSETDPHLREPRVRGDPTESLHQNAHDAPHREHELHSGIYAGYEDHEEDHALSHTGPGHHEE
ncbi:unnamed protein product [Hydatigera taeniaeformis]|uniref:PID domain-containing protein n=1 Tax=Hydatigena taeniaeformis TaxID=6205 RepID=A0A0R3WPZ2_HYDTA|nr:unnamed protein product [Hydatigera taeniaeformis]